jgi:hypothetical protein
VEWFKLADTLHNDLGGAEEEKIYPNRVVITDDLITNH